MGRPFINTSYWKKGVVRPLWRPLADGSTLRQKSPECQKPERAIYTESTSSRSRTLMTAHGGESLPCVILRLLIEPFCENRSWARRSAVAKFRILTQRCRMDTRRAHLCLLMNYIGPSYHYLVILKRARTISK